LQPEKEDSKSDLSAPQRTADILRGLNRQKYSLVMVALPSRRRAAEEEEEGEETLDTLAEREKKNIPVCRIIDKFAYAKAADEKEKVARKKELNRKELELNWAIAPNDLQHRLKQFREFLSKGRRVELMLAKKRHGRKATKEEGDTLMATLRTTAEEVGAKEVKLDGKFPGVVNLIFEGKADD
jgi:translation initiation factor IF-3